jgi:protocatechuate 3,4-dioxygenase alpha subunit
LKINKTMKQTPSQTVGPYFAYGLTPEQYNFDFKSLVANEMVDFTEHPDSITIEGRVFDGNGDSIEDAMIEVWQNDAKNELFGRYGTGTDKGNRFVFHTIKPEPLNGQAPFLTLIIFMRGQLLHSYTRLYFEDEAKLNDTDEVLNFVPIERRHTIIAKKTVNGYSLNIHMQGENETVFFDL